MERGGPHRVHDRQIPSFDGLEITDDLTITFVMQPVICLRINVFTDETNRSISEDKLGTARVVAKGAVIVDRHKHLIEVGSTIDRAIKATIDPDRFVALIA